MKKLLLATITLSVCIASFAQVKGSSAALIDRSKPPKAQPNPEIKINIPEVITMDNGLKVIVVENHKLPRVSFQLFVDYPEQLEGKKTGLSGIFGELLSSGTTNTSKDEFDKQIDFIGADLHTSGHGFFATSLKKHTPKLLGLLAEVIKSPAFPEEELDRIKNQTLSGLATTKSDPNSMADNVASVVNFGTKHPYGEITTESTVEKITLEDIKGFFKKNFIPNYAYLVIVGDVDQEEAKGYAKQYFGDWQSGTEAKPVAFPVAEHTGNNVYFVDKPGAVQSVIKVTETINLTPGHKDELKLKVLNQILGGGSFSARLMSNLREDKAYTYGCYSSVNSDKLMGTFSAGGSFRNEVTDSALTQILMEIKKIASEPVLEKELSLVKNSMTGAFARMLESPQTIARFALNTVRYNLPADYYSTYLKRLEALTINDLTEVAGKYIKPENLNIIVVGNAEIADKLLSFDSDGEISYKNHYGEDKTMLKQVPQGITAKTIIENFALKSLNCVSTTEIEGKLKKIGYIKTVSSATMEQYGATIEVQRHRAKPNKVASQTKIISPMGVQIAQKEWFDGEKGGSFAMGSGVKTYSDEEIEAKKASSFPFAQMHYFDNKHYEVKLMGIDEIDGQEYYKIKVKTDADDDFTYEYYSLKSGMLEMEETFAKDDKGNMTSVIIKFGDYKDVNGILLPHTMEMTTQGQIIKFTTSSAEVKKKGKTDAFIGDFD